MQLTNKVINTMESLKMRPSMFIPVAEITYDVLAIYVNGYLQGLSDLTGRSISRNIVHWYEEKNGILTSSVFTGYIRAMNRDKTEDEIKKLLLDNIQDFFRQNPNWQYEDVARSQANFDRVINREE